MPALASRCIFCAFVTLFCLVVCVNLALADACDEIGSASDKVTDDLTNIVAAASAATTEQASLWETLGLDLDQVKQQLPDCNDSYYLQAYYMQYAAYEAIGAHFSFLDKETAYSEGIGELGKVDSNVVSADSTNALGEFYASVTKLIIRYAGVDNITIGRIPAIATANQALATVSRLTWTNPDYCQKQVQNALHGTENIDNPAVRLKLGECYAARHDTKLALKEYTDLSKELNGHVTNGNWQIVYALYGDLATLDYARGDEAGGNKEIGDMVGIEEEFDPTYPIRDYWDMLSADERHVIAQHSGNRNDNVDARPCHVETFDSSLGHEVTWWYCDGHGNYVDAYTFNNGVLTSHYSP